MTATEARQVFDSAIATETDADRIAKLELLREYFTNAKFREGLHEYTFQLTQAA